MVESGDRIGADGELVECTDFKVDESLLTGESVPVFKTADSKGDNRILWAPLPCPATVWLLSPKPAAGRKWER